MPRSEAKKRFARDDKRRRDTEKRKEMVDIVESQKYVTNLFTIVRDVQAASTRIIELSQFQGNIAGQLVSNGLSIVKNVKKVFTNLRELSDFSLDRSHRRDICKMVILGFQYGMNSMKSAVSSCLKICDITKSQEWLNHSYESLNLLSDVGDLLEIYRKTMNFDENEDQEYIDPIYEIFSTIQTIYHRYLPDFIQSQKDIEGKLFLTTYQKIVEVQYSTQEKYERIHNIVDAIERNDEMNKYGQPLQEEGRELDKELRELYESLKNDVNYELSQCSILEKIVKRKYHKDILQKDLIAYMYDFLILCYQMLAESISYLVKSRIELSYYFHQGELQEKRKYIAQVDRYYAVLNTLLNKINDMREYATQNAERNEENGQSVQDICDMIQDRGISLQRLLRKAKQTPSFEALGKKLNEIKKEKRNLSNQRRKAAQNLSNRRKYEGVGGRRTHKKRA
jgi:hypothetical protein